MTSAQRNNAAAPMGRPDISPNCHPGRFTNRLASWASLPMATIARHAPGRGMTGRGSVTDWRSPGFFFVVRGTKLMQELLRNLSKCLPHRKSSLED